MLLLCTISCCFRSPPLLGAHEWQTSSGLGRGCKWVNGIDGITSQPETLRVRGVTRQAFFQFITKVDPTHVCHQARPQWIDNPCLGPDSDGRSTAFEIWTGYLSVCPVLPGRTGQPSTVDEHVTQFLAELILAVTIPSCLRSTSNSPLGVIDLSILHPFVRLP